MSGISRESTRHSLSTDTEGAHWVGSGTWLRDRWSDQIGVVVEIGDIHPGGTVKIEWRPSSTEWISVSMFLGELMRGRFEVTHS